MHPNLEKPAYSPAPKPLAGTGPICHVTRTCPTLHGERSSRSWLSGRPAGGELMTGRWSRPSCSACAPAALGAELPAIYGNANTLMSRYNRWKQDGTIDRITAALGFEPMTDYERHQRQGYGTISACEVQARWF